MKGSISDYELAEQQPEVVTVLASAARTVTGNSASVESPVAKTSKLALILDVTAVSGTTPSLAVTVEWSNDGISFEKADTADTFSAITAVGGAAKSFEIKGKFYRTVHTITGTTPSFTFSTTATGR